MVNYLINNEKFQPVIFFVKNRISHVTNELANVEKMASYNQSSSSIYPTRQFTGMKDQLAWLNEETYRIKGNFQSRFFDFKAKHGTDYIRKNQMSLLRLMDQIEDVLQLLEINVDPELGNFYSDIYLQLEKILQHLSRYYSAVIDDNLPMPLQYTAHERARLQPDYEQLLQLYEYPNVHKPLLDIAFRPLRVFFHRKSLEFTFKQYNYFRLITAELHLLLVAFTH